MQHVAISVIVQVLVGISSGHWWAGGLAMGAFYYGREITQAEYRWISHYGAGKRRSLPWWGIIDRRVWNPKSIADALVPALCSFIVWLVADGLPI